MQYSMLVNVSESDGKTQYRVVGMISNIELGYRASFSVIVSLEQEISQWHEDDQATPLELAIHTDTNPNAKEVSGTAGEFIRPFAVLGIIDIHHRIYLDSENGRGLLIAAAAERAGNEPCRYIHHGFSGKGWKTGTGLELLSKRIVKPGSAHVRYRFTLIIEESTINELNPWLRDPRLAFLDT